MPVIRLTAEDLEGDYDTKGRRRKGKKEKKGSKKDKKASRAAHEYEVDTEELMPAGAIDSDEEKRRRKKQGASDLADVDLTTPLAPDEVSDSPSRDGVRPKATPSVRRARTSPPLRSQVMPRNEHRIVSTKKPSSDALALSAEDDKTADAADGSKGTKSKKKDKGKAKGEKAKKEKGTGKKKATTAEPANDSSSLIDLLDMSAFGSAPPPAPSAVAADPLGLDVLSGQAAGGKPEKKSKKEKGSSKEKKSKKAGASSGHVWFTALAQGAMKVEFCTVGQAASRQVTVMLRATNGSGSDLFSNVSAALTEVPAGLQPTQTGPFILASTLGGGAAAETTIALALASPIERPLTLGLALSWYVEGLVADLAQAPLQLALPCSAFLVPTPISPDGFASLLSSHNWHSASAR